MDDITDQPKPTQSHITRQTAPPPHPDLPVPPNARAKTDIMGYFLVILGVAALTVLLAIISGMVLPVVVAIMTILATVHYWTWGRSLGKKLTDKESQRFRDQLQGVELSEVERPRHF
jgi:hypothetical protein